MTPLVQTEEHVDGGVHLDLMHGGVASYPSSVRILFVVVAKVLKLEPAISSQDKKQEASNENLIHRLNGQQILSNL